MENALTHQLQAQAQQAQGMAALQETMNRRSAMMSDSARTPDARPAPAAVLVKLSPADDVEAYLEVFEFTSTREGWAPATWAHLLAPFLSGTTQCALKQLNSDEAADFPKVKKAILAHYGQNLAARVP